MKDSKTVVHTSLKRPGFITTSRIKILHLTGRLCCAQREHKTPVRQGGVDSVYINYAGCSNVIKGDEQCFPDVEFLMLKGWPYYLPREFTCVFVVTVYIPPDANSQNALQELYEVISSYMTKQVDGIFIVACDFNLTDL